MHVASMQRVHTHTHTHMHADAYTQTLSPTLFNIIIILNSNIHVHTHTLANVSHRILLVEYHQTANFLALKGGEGDKVTFTDMVLTSSLSMQGRFEH